MLWADKSGHPPSPLTRRCESQPDHSSCRSTSPPPFVIPPPPPQGGEGHVAQKAQKIPGAKGAKENFYKAPKLIYTVILWYSFVVQSPPPPWGGEPSLRDRPPPRGKPSRQWWGDYKGMGRYPRVERPVPSGERASPARSGQDSMSPSLLFSRCGGGGGALCCQILEL